jgi:hypothetical protein
VLPKRVDALRSEKINAVFAGHDVSAAVSMAGKVWVWGAGFFWQLGQEDNKDRLVPTPLGTPRAPRSRPRSSTSHKSSSSKSKSHRLEPAQPRGGGRVFRGTEAARRGRHDVFDPAHGLRRATCRGSRPYGRPLDLGQLRMRGARPGEAPVAKRLSCFSPRKVGLAGSLLGQEPEQPRAIAAQPPSKKSKAQADGAASASVRQRVRCHGRDARPGADGSRRRVPQEPLALLLARDACRLPFLAQEPRNGRRRHAPMPDGWGPVPRHDEVTRSVSDMSLCLRDVWSPLERRATRSRASSSRRPSSPSRPSCKTLRWCGGCGEEGRSEPARGRGREGAAA